MATSVNLAPVPYQTPVTAQQGMLTVPWQAWFRQLANLVLTASQINAVAAAAAAAASATAAASSATSASGFSGTALTYSGNAATSQSSALTSAAQAAASAAAAAASAASASSQAFNLYNISAPTVVPVNAQMILFQRVSLLSGGRLQINGRGRIIA